MQNSLCPWDYDPQLFLNNLSNADNGSTLSATSQQDHGSPIMPDLSDAVRASHTDDSSVNFESSYPNLSAGSYGTLNYFPYCNNQVATDSPSSLSASYACTPASFYQDQDETFLQPYPALPYQQVELQPYFTTHFEPSTLGNAIAFDASGGDILNFPSEYFQPSYPQNLAQNTPTTWSMPSASQSSGQYHRQDSMTMDVGGPQCSDTILSAQAESLLRQPIPGPRMQNAMYGTPLPVKTLLPRNRPPASAPAPAPSNVGSRKSRWATYLKPTPAAHCPFPECDWAEGRKAFKNKNSISRHLLTHGPRRFRCPFCPEDEPAGRGNLFRRADQLQQ